ncbi:hypothetical protein PYW08_005242 [Mythimna loreyi]|uniref:Uncharacterized protein n=1 Tax=Mythimna loreyi TaxID=667449 RepID=A0ACC2QEY3_9NEOP|nr:hypothetical protein PYW08_005242 [Mythimna loreyi]
MLALVLSNLTVWPLNKLIMSKIVFSYFDVKGWGEQCRLLLTYGGEEFEDHRFTHEQWPEFKPMTPFGQAPVIEIDGKMYAQSLAISRYLGRKYRLVGDTPEDALEIDQNVDLLIDLILKAGQIYREPDAARKESLYAEAIKNVFPDYLERLNSIFSKNNGHIALGKLTWGDFVVAGSFDALKMVLPMPDIEKKYPAFQKVIDNVYSIPSIKAYSEAKK